MTNLPKTLTGLIKKHNDKIEFVDDERPTGDGYWVYLKHGWIFDHFTTFVHEYTIEQIKNAFSRVRKIK